MLTNTSFYHIKQFNTNAQCVNILKKLFYQTSFSFTFNKYMIHHHSLLDKYLTDNNYNSQSQKVIRGKINEYLILLYFQNQGIIHLYPQVYLFFIPDIKFDLVLFSQTKRIIAFNFKTCLRERYKQAMVEGQQLKKLDTRFEYYLLTNDATETQRLNNKITNGKVQGINQVINLFSPEANLFFKNLIQKNFIPFNNINLIKNKE
ncbi:MAG: hypothetical protein QS2022_1060 [Candidatus Phytoplasma asteris]|uniref:Uncharacterized protein n=2 Tax=16SrI (Aster yellows group) TaxID=3042590 RepID=Q6YQ53_ONYPE|nr:hypothetical protein ['Chrysanthemum coronarium' phytoplasma]TKA88134.1 MAG: hypothetical protein PLY_1050 [Periwinkle leaf yellowing phytoplasma]WEX19392.1 MAG: hypothetical protein QS2022_1060 [Candidatus Phytoplasma asteris]BAD04607.1 hypothetical protein PAM_522 [Onion yellows phytoplasma OY-M]GAK74055.1 uncharacterized protein OYV_05430 ['Chrysanthemum coronarium' phytoplasma]